MKKLLIVIFLLVSVFAFSQEIIYYNSTPTLQWDAVTEDVLPEDTVTYGVYLWDTALGDIQLQLIGDLTYFGMTSNTELLLSFPYRANWACAINTSLTDGEGNTVISELAYTTELPPVTETNPFVYAPNPSTLTAPTGLRDSGI